MQESGAAVAAGLSSRQGLVVATMSHRQQPPPHSGSGTGAGAAPPSDGQTVNVHNHYIYLNVNAQNAQVGVNNTMNCGPGPSPSRPRGSQAGGTESSSDEDDDDDDADDSDDESRKRERQKNQLKELRRTGRERNATEKELKDLSHHLGMRRNWRLFCIRLGLDNDKIDYQVRRSPGSRKEEVIFTLLQLLQCSKPERAIKVSELAEAIEHLGPNHWELVELLCS